MVRAQPSEGVSSRLKVAKLVELKRRERNQIQRKK